MQKIITIVGPTASGKTDLSLKLAKKFNGYIIATDSRTLYKEMDIGTAKPTPLLSPRRDGVNPVSTNDFFFVNNIPHYGINLIKPTETFNVAEFKKYTEDILDNTPRCCRPPLLIEGSSAAPSLKEGVRRMPGGRCDMPFLVGGTGLYVSAIVDNLSFPAAPPNEEFRKEKDTIDLNVLVSELLEKDPAAEQIVDLKNKRRVIRSLEVINYTGKLFSDLYKKGPQKYNILMLGVKRDREEIYSRINTRVDEMLTQGFEEECKMLKEKYGCNAPGMSAIGYAQFCNYLNSKLSKEEAVEKWKQAERNYAKRQLTWFNRDKRIHWVQNTKEAESLINRFLLNKI